MRRRQTVFGDQLLNAKPGLQVPPVASTGANISPMLAPSLAPSLGPSLTPSLNPSLGNNLSQRNVGQHIRSFSRLSSMRPPPNPSVGSEEAIGDASSLLSSVSVPDVDPALVSNDFDVQLYLESTAAQADAAQILQFGEKMRQQLQKINDAESQSFQSNQHALITLASSVLKIAKVVSDLHKEVAELSLVTEAMRQDAYAHSLEGSSSKASMEEDVMNRRQSVLALNSLWAHDLQTLYQRVENAQQVIPFAPGRHVALEEHGWLEINLVTLKSVKPVLLILLNDYLVISSSKHGKYVLDQHWKLDNQISFDLDEERKVLTVEKGTNSRGLLAPSLSRLRKVYSELCKFSEIGSNQETMPWRSQASQARRSRQNMPSISSLQGLESQRSHLSYASHASHTSISERSPETKREIGRILAEIDSVIAYRKWPEAVDLVLQHTKDPLLSTAIAERSQKLTSLLLSELTTLRPKSKSESIALLNLLSQLGHDRDARHALLDTAARDIESQQRSVHFMGDVVNYISQMAAIYFQTIIATVEIYRSAFPEEENSSLVVSWAKTQVDIYAGVFNRQLFRIAPELRGYQKCREVSRQESSQLKSLRMEMEFMLKYVWEQ